MKVAWAVFLAWFLAQLCKVLLHAYRSGKWEWSRIWMNGSMPSAHSSAVAALCLSVFLEEGFSLLWATCIVFSLIVLNDSLNVRWQTGVQASLLTQLIGPKKTKPLSNTVGHTLSEVGAGMLLGLLITLFIYGLI